MKVKVDKNLCIGCGACQAIEPSVFELEDDGLAKAIDEEIKDEVDEITEDAKEAEQGCPVSAIEIED